MKLHTLRIRKHGLLTKISMLHRLSAFPNRSNFVLHTLSTERNFVNPTERWSPPLLRYRRRVPQLAVLTLHPVQH